jgi:hypothetical protein
MACNGPQRAHTKAYARDSAAAHTFDFCIKALYQRRTHVATETDHS